MHFGFRRMRDRVTTEIDFRARVKGSLMSYFALSCSTFHLLFVDDMPERVAEGMIFILEHKCHRSWIRVWSCKLQGYLLEDCYVDR